MGKVIVAASAVLALLLAGYFVAVRINPALAGGDVATQSVEGEDNEAYTGTVEVDGTITPLSEPSEPGFFLLRIMGEGYLPIVVDESLGEPGLASGVVLAVPSTFEGADDRAELFTQLRDLADSTGKPLRVVEFTD
jgi:hypothetical protein